MALRRLSIILVTCAAVIVGALSCGDDNPTGSAAFDLRRVWISTIDTGAYTSSFIGDLVATDDGGAIVTGSGHDGLTNSLLVTRLDNRGNVVWEKPYPPGTSGTGYSLLRTADHNYAVLGYISSPGSYISLFLIDSTGTPLWPNPSPLGYFSLNSNNVLAQTDDGGFVAVGRHSPVDSDTRMVRTSPTGQILWSRTATRDGLQDFRGITCMQDGRLLLARVSNDGDPNAADFELVCTNDDGDELWMRDFGQSGTDIGQAMVRTDFGYVVGGWQRRRNLDDVRIIGLDTAGHKIWEYVESNDRHTSCQDIIVAANGDLLAVGYDLPHCCGMKGNVLLLRLSPQGRLIWRKKFGPYELDYQFALAETPDGSILVGFADADTARVAKVAVIGS